MSESEKPSAVETIRSAENDFITAALVSEKMYHMAGLLDPESFTAAEVATLKATTMEFGSRMMIGTRKIIAVLNATIDTELETA